jgi:TolA-binding protein
MSPCGLGPLFRMKFFFHAWAWGWLAASAWAQDTVAPVAQPVNPAVVDTNPAPVAQPVTPGLDATSAPLAPPADTSDAGKPFTDTSAGAVTVVNVASARFDEATVAYTARRYAEAVQSFTDFVRGFPQDRRVEEALFHLAESYRNLNRTDDALAAYAYQVQHFPDGPFRANAELRRGAILFDQHKFTDAIPCLQFAADKSQGELQQAAKYLLGRVDLATRKEPDGRALLQGLVDQQPPGKLAAGAAQTLAELDDAQNRPAEALALWQKAMALSTDPAAQATAAARGGWAALGASQPAVAEKLFQKARQLGASGTTREVANTGLLRVLFAQKRYAEWLAVDASEKDHLLASARSEILYDVGHAQFSLEHWPEAVVAFDAYLSEFGTQPGAVNATYERFLAAVQADPAQTLTQADVYLNASPQSPYRLRVLLLKAQELSRQQKYADAVPVWETLAAAPPSEDLPRKDILLERARAYDELHNWPKAANAYRDFIDENGRASAKTTLSAAARLAVCLQNDGQGLAATEAWKAVQAQAPADSPEQQVALESLGLIYAHGGPAQAALMASTFRLLLDRFPQTKLRALASFSVGDWLFQNRDYAGAEPYLLNARSWNAAAWTQPATQRLALGAYGRKDWPKLLAYAKEYDAIPGADKIGPLPAALFYSLAENARQTGDLEMAEDSYERVTILPDAGDLLGGAWWQLGEVEAARKEWPAAVISYEKYRQLKPEAKNATAVLLALGRTQLGAGMLDAAKATAQQALLGEPEGPNSAAARMLLGEIAYAAQNYPEAARMFATLALLFDKPQIAPQAMARAADAFEKAGDAKSAADWRGKLKAKYPQFQEKSYLWILR